MGYMRVFSDFWRGKTGRQIAEEPPLVRCVSAYLLTGQPVESSGVYRIHLPDAAYEIGSGADERQVAASLARLGELGFSLYDPASEFVWVRRMAYYQFSPFPLHQNDNRAKHLDRWYRACADNPFLGPWWDMYAGPDALALSAPRRDVPFVLSTVRPSLPSPPLALASPSEAPSEALTLLPEPTKRAAPQGFDTFWKLYPKQRAKARCEVEWRRQKITAQDVTVMVEKLEDPYEYWPEWMQGKILDPVNFLKDRRWLDGPAPKVIPVSERAQRTLQGGDRLREMMQRQIGVADSKGMLSDGSERKG